MQLQEIQSEKQKSRKVKVRLKKKKLIIVFNIHKRLAGNKEFNHTIG